jgi:hypothetical protein
MAVANEKWQFVFLAEPHTASRAVRDALLKLPSSYKAGSHHISMRAMLNYKNLRHRKHNYYTTFCVVRNPADIMVTIWLQSYEYTKQGQTLGEFIRRFGVNKPTTYFFKHAPTANHVLCYEDLQEELNCLLRSLYAPSVTLDTVGPTKDKEPWFRYYTIEDLEYMLSNFPEVPQWGYVEAIQRQISAKLENRT